MISASEAALRHRLHCPWNVLRARSRSASAMWLPDACFGVSSDEILPNHPDRIPCLPPPPKCQARRSGGLANVYKSILLFRSLFALVTALPASPRRQRVSGWF